VRLLWTAFGLGLSPFAPGTFGTLLGVALALVAPPGWGLLAGVVAVTGAGLLLAPAAARATGRADPPEFVLDEVAGYLATLLFLPRGGPWVLAGAFLAFRLFDIWKPWPIRRIERLPGGWGAMADDLAAAVYAQATLRLCLLAL